MVRVLRVPTPAGTVRVIVSMRALKMALATAPDSPTYKQLAATVAAGIVRWDISDARPSMRTIYSVLPFEVSQPIACAVLDCLKCP